MLDYRFLSFRRMTIPQFNLCLKEKIITIIYCTLSNLFNVAAEFTFSQPSYNVSEDDGVVSVCLELTESILSEDITIRLINNEDTEATATSMHMCQGFIQKFLFGVEGVAISRPMFLPPLPQAFFWVAKVLHGALSLSLFLSFPPLFFILGGGGGWVLWRGSFPPPPTG